MNDDATFTIARNVICILLSVLLAAGLGFLYYRDRQQENVQTDTIEALQAEAAPYENELNELRSQLSGLESSFTYTREKASVMVGFAVTDAAELSYIEEKAAQYGFSPVLVLDCTMELTDVEAIVEAADEDWEIMLYAANFSEEANDDVLAVLSYLEDAGRKDTGMFLLRGGYDGAANIELLAQDGFVGYTSYHEETPQAGQTEEGYVYFDYSYLSAEGTGVTGRLAALLSRKAAMIVVFDMASVDAGALPETYVDSLLKLLQEYDEREDCAFSTVADVVEELSGINALLAASEAEYEAQAAALSEQIAELEETVAGIYARLTD
ncbi:MAG: hypothetical protein LUC95_09270 [Lachnospiraceae bacterium]|nr:hypothetical protein [Lachnospiraceae bacterium]